MITAVTLAAVEPIFLLTAREEPMSFDRVASDFDELVAENEHFEFYWFPHTGGATPSGTTAARVRPPRPER
ncbi:hypothetical protein SCALM49S_04698 [Streptomyces californicus]